MNSALENQEQQLIDMIHVETEAYEGLQDRLREVDAELAELAPQREQYHLLGVVCDSLDRLNEMGAVSMFWGEGVSSSDHEGRITDIRERATGFNENIGVLTDNRAALVAELVERRDNLSELKYHLDSVREEAVKREFDFIVEREGRDDILFRPGLLPWSKSEEDKRRQRKSLLVALVTIFIVGVIPAVWILPPPDPDEKIEIPERLAKLVREKAKPRPVEKKPPKIEEEKPVKEQVAEQKPKEKPKPAEVSKAKEKVKNKGILAHQNIFSDLTEDADLANLGADARIAGVKSLGGAAANGAKGSRALITATTSTSGGVAAVASVSRGGVGSGRGNAISGNGLSVGSVSSGVADQVGEAKASSDAIGPARTDEEIQIVFDRYKAALYRIYNRELRTNPTLRGKMVLELVIEPDGTVSRCRVDSTDMDSKTLSTNIVARVKAFNFGAKDGVPTTKILYPIDFLPAG